MNPSHVVHCRKGNVYVTHADVAAAKLLCALSDEDHPVDEATILLANAREMSPEEQHWYQQPDTAEVRAEALATLLRGMARRSVRLRAALRAALQERDDARAEVDWYLEQQNYGDLWPGE